MPQWQHPGAQPLQRLGDAVTVALLWKSFETGKRHSFPGGYPRADYLQPLHTGQQRLQLCGQSFLQGSLRDLLDVHGL